MRRRAAAAVVAVLVSAGLAACGNGGSNPRGAEDAGGRPKLPLGPSLSRDAGGVAASTASESATDAAPSMIAPARPIEYRLADGAEAPATEATAYRLVSAEGAARGRLAEALGVDRADIRIQPGGYSWSYSAEGPDSSVKSSGAVACSSDGECAPPPPPPTIPGLLTNDQAEAKARRVLTAAGIDLDGARVEVFGDPSYGTSVNVTHAVDGRPVDGLATFLTFGAAGDVIQANGFFGEVEAVGRYPLVDLAEALARFEVGVGGFGGGVGIATAEDTTAVAGGGASGDPGTGAPTDEPVMTIEPQPSPPPVPLEPEIVELESADVVLQLVYPTCPGGPMYLVPAFRFSPQGLSVVAVADESLTGAEPAGAEPAAACPGQSEPDVPVGRPEPAPLPPDAPTEPGRP